MPAKFKSTFFSAFCLGLIRSLPNKTSRNSRRLQFFLKFATLFLYAWSTGIKLIPISIFRTAEQQRALYRIGREIELDRDPVTTKDGYRKHSRHQHWEAGDVAILEFKNNAFRIVWAPRELYFPLCEFWEKLGGTSGYRWTNPCDPYHFEL